MGMGAFTASRAFSGSCVRHSPRRFIPSKRLWRRVSPEREVLILRLFRSANQSLQEFRHHGGGGLGIFFHRIMTEVVEDLEPGPRDIVLKAEGIPHGHPRIL